MGTELHDNKGLICGFHLAANGALSGPAVDIDLAACAALEPGDGLAWLHFNLNDARAREWIARLDEDGREMLLSADRSVRLEPCGDAVAGALADIHADDPDGLGVIVIHVERARLITGRHHPMTSAALLRADLLGGAVFEDVGALFNRLLEHFAATFGKATLAHADLVDDIEDQVFAGDYQHSQLGQLRRTMARMRRQIGANRHALGDFAAHPPPWWHKAAAKDLRRIAGALNTVAQDLELAQERARLITEEIDARMTERTNRNLYFISLAAAAFLPITLISGIFGMNVGGLPWVEDENGFYWTIGCMAAAVAVAFVWLLRRRML